MHIPDKWAILERDGEAVILAGWGGGYLYGDSWRRSSSIKAAKVGVDGALVATTYSGSQYKLGQGGVGYTGTTIAIKAHMDAGLDTSDVVHVWHDEEFEDIVERLAQLLSM